MHTKATKSTISFVVVLITVVLAFCVLIGSAVAWLTRSYNPHSEDNQIGEVEVALYHNNAKITGTTTVIDGVAKWQCDIPYKSSGGNVIRTFNLKMRNEGTVDALVRATISMYYIDSNNNRVGLILVDSVPTTGNTCKIDTSSWILDFAGDNGVVGGYMFYNDQLAPYTYKEITSDIPGDDITEVTVPANEKSIINSIVVSEDLKNTVIYTSVTLEAIAYSGNIYQKLENGDVTLDNTKYSALPFGTKEELPSEWVAWKRSK